MSTRRKVQPDPETVAKSTRVAELKAEESATLSAAVNQFIRAHLEDRLITTRLEVDELRAELEQMRAAGTVGGD